MNKRRLSAPASKLPGLCDSVAAVASGRSSVRHQLEVLLDRIDIVESTVQAWAHIDRQACLRAADDLDRQRQSGNFDPAALHGFVFAAKDNFDTGDMPTAYGSPIHASFQPARDASCIATLRHQGALLLGKTITTEFAHVHPGPTRNPFDEHHTPGGSSSGSAAAVAAGMVPLAFGTQTTGSVIRPAAYCGTVGFKPTYGHINVAGVLPNSPSFDTVGMISRSVQDIDFCYRRVLDIDARFDDEKPRLADLKFGVCRTPFWDKADAEAHRCYEEALVALQEFGVETVEFSGDSAFDGLLELSQVVSGYEFSRTLAHERRVAEQSLSLALRQGRMGSGLKVAYADYVNAQVRLREARNVLDEACRAVDVVISLPAPGVAPEGLSQTGDAIFNMPWTTLHGPAITLPLFRSDSGMPLGLQLTAARHKDLRLLSIAETVMSAFG